MNILPDFATMVTSIGKSVYRHLEAGIKSRWSLVLPEPPVAPIPKKDRNGVDLPVPAGKLADHKAQMLTFDIANRQLNALLVAMYLDPTLQNNNVWNDDVGQIARTRCGEVDRDWRALE